MALLGRNPTFRAAATGLACWLGCVGGPTQLLFAHTAAVAGTGAHTNVVFNEYSALSGNAELAHRLLSPLAAEALERNLARSGKQLTGQPLDVSAERFTLYVPPSPPAGGYGVLVFVSPSDDGRLPSGWAAALDQNGIIYVSASHSGNEADVLTRRVPLAILAATNVSRQFPVDPQRVYIGGFSGGSRAALRVALGYPDVFRGALLDAGGDPIGNERIPLPPRSLFRQFQSSRIVFLTGSEDTLHLEQATQSIQSLQRWCEANVSSSTIPGVHHEIASSSALSAALGQLHSNVRSFDPDKLAACNTAIEKDVDVRLQRVADVIAKGDRREARGWLRKLDSQYGGLAAPRLLELARECDCNLFD